MSSQRVAVDAPGATASATFRVLESFEDAASTEVLRSIRRRVGIATSAFPELAGETITIARRAEWDTKLGRADMRNRIIYLPEERATSFVTAYHELGHLAIQLLDERGEDVPTTSEEFCSLFALSKMPVDHIDEDRVPYFDDPVIPKDEWPDVATAALAYREENHDYIRQAERWFQGDWTGEEVTAGE